MRCWTATACNTACSAPILDMKDPAQAALIRPISDAVAALTKRYGGLLWGEHGKGLRSQYVPEYALSDSGG